MSLFRFELILFALLCLSPMSRSEVKRSAPLWLRGHYREELAWQKAVEEPDPEEVEELAIVIYCEAGADAISDETRYMVGDVVLNRVADDRFPDSIHAVLAQKAQYGRFYWTGIVWPERAKNACEAHAVARAREIAYNLLTGTHSELFGGGYIWQAEFKQGKGSILRDGIYFGR